MKRFSSRKLTFQNGCSQQIVKNKSLDNNKDCVSVYQLNIGDRYTGSKLFNNIDNSTLTIDNSVNITGNIYVDSAIINENLMCKNIDVDNEIIGTDLNLIGDIISTNCRITDQLHCKTFDCESLNCKTLNCESATMEELKLNSAQIEKDLQCQNINADNISCNAVDTDIINSKNDLIINFQNNNCLVVPNVKYRTVVNNTGVITPVKIKTNRFFIVTTTTILQGDSSCDGMQIVIYNNSNAPIVVRDPFRIVIELLPLRSVSVAYLSVINRFIIS